MNKLQRIILKIQTVQAMQKEVKLLFFWSRESIIFGKDLLQKGENYV